MSIVTLKENKNKILIPKTICFRLTRACNMECPFCQAPPTKSKQMTINEIERAIQLFRNIGMESIKFTGGEPYVRKDINKIITFCYSEGVAPIVCTNATMITQEDINVLKASNAKVKVSLHGEGVDHDRLVNCNVSEKVIENIKKMISAGIFVSLHTIVDNINIENIKVFLENSIKIGIRKISLIALVPRGRSIEFNSDCLSIQTLKEKHATLKKEFGNRLDLRVLDFSKPYYVLESDGSLWIQRASEDNDTLLLDHVLDSNGNLITE